MDKPIEEMTLEELNLLSAKLHDEFYAVKNKIQAVQQWRNRRGVEEDALRHIAEAQARLQEATAITPTPMVVAPESIKSDEAVVGTGGFRKMVNRIVKIVRVGL